MAFSFIHAADIHLDTSFQTRDGDLRKLLRCSIRNAFKSCIDLAIEKNVDAFLIAGDIFDNDMLSFTTEKLMFEEFSRLEGNNIKVFYAPGNHDPYGVNFRLGQIRWPSNVHIFKNTKPERVYVYDSNGHALAVVVGAGHESKRESRNIGADFPQSETGIPYIGLLHALVLGSGCQDEHGRYAPCSQSDLAEKGYTYWALGHIHTRQEVMKKPLTIYPGNISGRNPKETGAKGAYLVEVKDNGEVAARFIELSPIHWEEVEVDNLSHAKNLYELEECILKSASKKLGDTSTNGKPLLRVLLSGACPLYAELEDEENIKSLEEDIKSNLSLEHIEVLTDGITKPVCIDEYKNQAHVLGKALEIIDSVKHDDELLLKLMPEHLAGCSSKSSDSEKISYLRELVKNLDYEAAATLLGGEEDEA